MVLETEVTEPVIAYLQEKNFKTFTEVPILKNRIDIVGVKPSSDEILAVEAKVRKWRKAIQQALVYRLCCHKVYVALWHKHLHAVRIKVFVERGIGVLSVDGDVEVVQEPKLSGCIHDSLIGKLENYLKSKGKGLYDSRA